MEIQLIIALAIAIPVILFPATFLWFINVSGLLTVWKEGRARERRKARVQKEAIVETK